MSEHAVHAPCRLGLSPDLFSDRAAKAGNMVTERHQKQPQMRGIGSNEAASRIDTIAAFPILADPVDVKKGDQLCETVSQPTIRPDKVDPPIGS